MLFSISDYQENWINYVLLRLGNFGALQILAISPMISQFLEIIKNLNVSRPFTPQKFKAHKPNHLFDSAFTLQKTSPLP